MEKKKDNKKEKAQLTEEKVETLKFPRSILAMVFIFFCGSMGLVVKGILAENRILLYVSGGLAISIIISLIAILLLVLNKKMILNNMKMMLMKGSGFGKVKIIQSNGYFSTFIRKFTPEGFEIGGIKYRFDKKRVSTDDDGEKCIHYRWGDVEPLDLLQEDIPLIDGKLYGQDLAKAMSAGALSVQTEGKDWIYILTALSFLVNIVVGVLVFKMYGDITTLMQLV